MKNVILVIVGIALMSSCVPKQKHDEVVAENIELKEQLQNSKSLIYPEEFIKELCEKRKVDPYRGTFMSEDTAKKHLEAYKDKRRATNPGYKPKDDIYGFAFGIEAVRNYIETLDLYNRNRLPTDPFRITGIRIYRSVNLNSPIKHDDVFLVPVINNKGLNLYNIDKDHTKASISFDSIRFEWEKSFKDYPKLLLEDAILNTSKPCPNLCDN